MQKENVKYKSLDPGCSVDVQALTAENNDTQVIISTRTRSRPTAGLVVDSKDPFEAGSRVVLDVAFPDQPYTYRSRGIVSWTVKSPVPDRPHKLGVLIFGMDKLDPYGVSVSPDPPDFLSASCEPTLPLSLSQMPELDRGLMEEEEVGVYFKVEAASSESESENERKPSPLSVAGELVALCPTNLKIAGWLSAPIVVAPDSPTAGSATEKLHVRKISSIPPAPSVGSLSEELDGISAGNNDEVVRQSSAGEPLLDLLSIKETFIDFDKNISETTLPRRDSISAAVSGFVAFEPEDFELDIHVDFEVSFDAEQQMIIAFERMHEMYEVDHQDHAAAFALAMARDLITCEAAECMLVSPQKFELYSAANVGLNRESDIGITWPVTDGVAGAVIRVGTPIQIDDPKENPIYEPESDDRDDFSTKNMLTVPVHHDGHAIGVIQLRNSPRVDGFMSGEANVLAYIGTALAEFISMSLPSVTNLD